MVIIALLLSVLLFLLPGCVNSLETGITNDGEDLFRPNFVMILTEDISPMLACYGDSTVNTPNLDRLASEGMVFNAVYSTAGVCAPSRAAIITGMYPASVGANHMRTRLNGNKYTLPVKEYDVVMPEEVRCFTELFRSEGYYCTNKGKRDWQFNKLLTAFDDYGKDGAHWRNRKEGQPFFSIINIFITHESMVWANSSAPLRCSPSDVKVPPYYPDTEIVRKDIARVYSNIVEMDSLVGIILTQLEEDELLDSSYVIFFSDHGGPLPRQKREIIHSGLNVPMLIRFPGGKFAGTKNDQLISFVDLAPTFLSLANIEIPDYIHGKAFLGGQKTSERKYIFAARDRMDSELDRVRSVCDGKFLYVRNYHPEKPWIQDIEYRKNLPMMQQLLRFHEEGRLDSIQSQWFEDTKPEEQLFDIRTDPFEINDLAEKAVYSNKLQELRDALYKWNSDFGDMGSIPEEQMISQMWPGFKQPVTCSPSFNITDDYLELTCDTPGSSIAWCICDDNFIPDPGEPNGWNLYIGKIPVPKNKTLWAVANRIGFKNSPVRKYQLPESSN